MRILTFILALITLALSLRIASLVSDTRLLNYQIKEATRQLSALKQEQEALAGYKSEAALSLDRLYPEVFNAIKELASYYRADCEINIIGARDFVNTREFFKDSPYKGIKYLDVLCRIDLANQPDTYLFDLLYEMLTRRPVEILEVSLEKNILNLTLRLYGA